MKLRMILAGATVAALAVPVVAGAAPAVTKVTGGGQTLVDSEGNSLGKDTIGFNAQTDGTNHKGQVQFVDRADDGSQTQYHGDVTCISLARETNEDGSQGDPIPNAAVITGKWRKINGKTAPPAGAAFFELYVQDNGEGANASGADIVTMQPHLAADPGCSTSAPADEDVVELARGNVQFHKGKPASRKRSQTSAPKVVSLAGLR